MTWFFPSWNGDFRLLVDDKNPKLSKLEIVEPTDAEAELLLAFIGHANDKRWTHSPRRKKLRLVNGKQIVRLRTTVAEAGAALLPLLKPGDQTLTAVELEGGQLRIVEGTSEHALAEVAAAMAEPEPDVEAPPAKKKKEEEEEGCLGQAGHALLPVVHTGRRHARERSLALLFDGPCSTRSGLRSAPSTSPETSVGIATGSPTETARSPRHGEGSAPI